MDFVKAYELAIDTFQSPKSGKFESNELADESLDSLINELFQSPRSGKFESNKTNTKENKMANLKVSIP